MLRNFLLILLLITIASCGGTSTIKKEKDENHILKGKYLYDRDSLTTAKFHFKQELKKENGNKKALYYLGAIARKEDSLQLSEDYLYKYLEIFSFDQDAVLLYANINMENKNYFLAKEYLNKIKDKALKDENKNQVFYSLGLCEFNTGNYEKAAENFKKIDKEFFAFDEANYYIAKSYQELSYFPKAIPIYQKLIEKDKFVFESSYELGNIYADKRKYSESLKYFKKAYESNPHDKFAVVKLAESYFDNDKFKKAEEFYEKSLMSEPEKLTSIYKLAICYEMNRKFSKAKSEYQKLIRLGKNDSTARKLIDYAYERLNELEKIK